MVLLGRWEEGAGVRTWEGGEGSGWTSEPERRDWGLWVPGVRELWAGPKGGQKLTRVIRVQVLELPA